MMTPPQKTLRSRFLVTVALTATAALAAAMLSACGKIGTLEQAPPLYGDEAKASWSSSNLPGGGNMTTNSTSASRESEKALPDANGRNQMDDPYKGNKKIQDAPLEGFGNATKFNNNSPQ